MTTIDSLLSELEQVAGSADQSLRYGLSGHLQRLARSIATPRQVMQHYGYMHTEQVIAKVAVDLDLFSILSQSERPMKTEEIASMSGGDVALLDRVLRHLASTYTIAGAGESTFTANETTRLLASPAGKGNIIFGFDTLNKAFQELPNFLKTKSHENPDQPLDTAFNRAYDTNLQFFLWFQQDQERIRSFHPSLTAFQSPVLWTAVVPLVERLQDADNNAPLFVDVGGGHGNQCAAFRKATADRFPGRVINQDLPETLAGAPKYDDIEMMAQDFYEKQQVQGAKIYYTRQCLHNLPDMAAQQVLQQIRDAMSPQSLLFVDELVIPETGASEFAMQLDVTMMTAFNSKERTISQWRSLLDSPGLAIREVHKYDPELEYSIMEAVSI